MVAYTSTKYYEKPTFEVFSIEVIDFDAGEIVFKDREQSSGAGYMRIAYLKGLVEGLRIAGHSVIHETEHAD